MYVRDNERISQEIGMDGRDRGIGSQIEEPPT